MSHFDDDAPEMPRNQPFDDEAIDAIFTGATREDNLADLAAFVSDVRVSAETAHTPSPALAAALAGGFSTEKGALSTTTASNVHGPARQASGLPKWRKLRMKIQGLIAGLGVAGKVALGASLAAAATTGAGAAGILPGPVQHIVATTVGSVTPFHMPGDGANTAGGPALEGVLPEPTSTTAPQTTTTTVHTTSNTTHEPTTTAPRGHDGGAAGGGGVAPPSNGGSGDSGGSGSGDGGGGGDNGGGVGGVVTSTTEHHGSDGSGSGTEPAPTTTTAPRGGSGGGGDGGGGDSNNPQSLSISCERAQNPNRISCHWSASTGADHDKYVLLRITSLNEAGRVLLQSPDALTFGDTTVAGGVGYGYRVISLRSDGSVEAHSNIWTIMCCGDAGSGDGGTTTTTSTTSPHDGTTTSSTPH